MSEQKKNETPQNTMHNTSSVGGIVFRRERSAFMISSQFVLQLANSGADFTVVLTYLLLARGVGQLDGRRTTSSNAAFIISKTQWDNDTVTEAIEWLKQQGYIEMVEVLVDKERTAQWLINDGALDTSMPISLIDGNGVTPLIRLYSPRILSEEENLMQVDHLIVLCILYLYNDMTMYSGIDPRIGLYRRWIDFNKAYSTPIVNIVNSDAAIYEVKGRTEVMFQGFANQFFTYITDESDRLERVANALQRLILNGYLYETAQIWDTDPLGQDGDEAIPLYVIYVHDIIAKTDEPALQKMIQRVAYRLGVKDGYSEFTEIDYEKGDAVSFRFVGDKQVGGFPIGIFRLKFKASGESDLASMDAESVRASAWLRELQYLFYSQ